MGNCVRPGPTSFTQSLSLLPPTLRTLQLDEIFMNGKHSHPTLRW